MKTREYAEKDQTQVVELWKKCGLTVPQNNPYKDIDRKLKVDPDLFLVGEIDKKIVATVMGGYEGHRGWINYLAVDPVYQKQGLGKQIMAVVENRLKDKGCPKINLQVRESNIDAIKFYMAIGFDVDKVVGLGKRLEKD